MHAAVCRGLHRPRAIIGLGWPPLATTRLARPLNHDDCDPGSRNVRFTHIAALWAEIGAPLRGFALRAIDAYRINPQEMPGRTEAC